MKNNVMHDDQYLRANIVVSVKRKKLMKNDNFERLLEIEFGKDLTNYLAAFDYYFRSESFTISDIDDFYKDYSNQVLNDIENLRIPELIKEVLFLKAIKINEATIETIDKIDRNILQTYAKLIEEYDNEKSDKELIVEFSKIKLDYYFLEQCFRINSKEIVNEDLCRGYLTVKDLKSIWNLEIKDAKEKFKNTIYGKIFAEDLELEDLSLIFDELLLKNFSKYSKKVFGLEAIFAYIYHRIIELFNLRLILKGKIYGMSNEEILSKMRNVYV